MWFSYIVHIINSMEIENPKAVAKHKFSTEREILWQERYIEASNK